MRPALFKALTWGTVSAAVASAFWLAAADLGWAEWRNPLAVPEAAFKEPARPVVRSQAVRTPSAKTRQPAPRKS